MSVRTGFGSLANRAFQIISRATLVRSDDKPKWQEVKLRARHGAVYDKVEVAHPYGLTYHPKQPSDDKTSEAPEIVLLFPDGNRSHPIAMMVGDRRYRPQKLKEGEVALHDDIGQMALLKRDFVRVLTVDTDGTKRFASLAHVEKKKQGSSGQGQSADTKHEGDKVNTEVRCSKDRIEFRANDAVVGYYNVSTSTWVFIGNVKLGSEGANKLVHRQGDVDSHGDIAVGSASKVFAA